MMLTDKRVDTEAIASGRVAVARDWTKVGISRAVDDTAESLFAGLASVTAALYHCPYAKHFVHSNSKLRQQVVRM